MSTTEDQLIKAVDNSTKFQFANPIKGFNFRQNPDGSVDAIPVVLISSFSNNNQVVPAGSVVVTDANSNNGANIEILGAVTTGLRGMDANAVQNVWDGTAFQIKRIPSLISSALAAAASVQLVAAGGAGKKYRIFSITLQQSVIKGSTATATVNEVTSGVVLCQVAVNAGLATDDTNISKTITIPDGIPQPTANNAIQVTATGANCDATAEIVYGPAE